MNATVTRRPVVFFCYARPAGFSGQKEATELVMRGLAGRGWDCRALPQPVFDRDTGGRGAVVRFVGSLVAAWARALRLLLAPDAALCVNLGLTWSAFVRDAVPLLLGRLGLGRNRLVVSLHGSLFMQWEPGSLKARVFRLLLVQAGVITVLGEKQRARLMALGVPGTRVEVVINSCALPPLSAAQLHAKWAALPGKHRPLSLLHLSSLIATKGFPEYLEAVAALAIRPGPLLDVVLCGKVTASEFQDRFPNAVAAEGWIGEMIARINRSDRVKVRWVRGAVGAEKAALFRDADIFVLPTRYAVEAQPLVLLEAMAAGCAIITTRVGEIPTILDDSAAIFLGAGTSAELAAAIEEWSGRPEALAGYAGAAHRRFTEHYALAHHLDGWEARLAPARVTLPAPVEPLRSES